MIWKKSVHKGHKEWVGMPPELKKKMKGMMPRYQWVSHNGRFSIIEPCGVTFGAWEIMDYQSKVVERFNSFEEAEKYAEAII